MFRQDPSSYGAPNLAADIMEGATPSAPVPVVGEVVTVGMSERVAALEEAVRGLAGTVVSLRRRVADLERNQQQQALFVNQSPARQSDWSSALPKQS